MVSFPDSHHDLLNTDVGVLATVGHDGYPQVSAVWFVFDDGLIKISLNSSRQKLKNLRRDPECTFLLLDPKNLYRTMEVRARAEIAPDTDGSLIDLVANKYNADVRAHDAPDQTHFAVTLHPVKINTWG